MSLLFSIPIEVVDTPEHRRLFVALVSDDVKKRKEAEEVIIKVLEKSVVSLSVQFFEKAQEVGEKIKREVVQFVKP